MFYGSNKMLSLKSLYEEFLAIIECSGCTIFRIEKQRNVKKCEDA